jgi:hypothetical protein
LREEWRRFRNARSAEGLERKFLKNFRDRKYDGGRWRAGRERIQLVAQLAGRLLVVVAGVDQRPVTVDVLERMEQRRLPAGKQRNDQGYAGEPRDHFSWREPRR